MIRYRLTDGTLIDVDPTYEQIFLASNPGAVISTQEQAQEEVVPPVEQTLTSQQETDEEPSAFSTLMSNLGLGFVEFGKGFENIKEGIQLGVTELIMPGEMSATEKTAALQAIRKTNVLGNSESYDPIIEKLEENIPEYETQSITEDIEQGNYSQAGFRAVNAALRSAPSLVAAATGAGGLIALGTSVAGNKFEEEFEEDPEKSTGKILAASGVSGITEATFELATRGLLKRAGFLNSQGNVTAARELIKGGAANLVKNIGFGIVGEGASESATELVSKTLADYVILGKEYDQKELLYSMGDGFIVGSLVGGAVSSVGEVTKQSDKAKDRAEAILMPENAKNQISKKAQELNDLIDDLPNVSEEGKEIVNEKINEIENEIIGIKRQSSSLINNLQGEDLVNYSKNIEEINKAKSVLVKAKTSSEKNIAQDKYKTLQEQNISILESAKAKAAEKVTETVKEQIKEAGLEGEVVEMTSEEISNIKEEGFNSKQAAKQFGFINQRTDGSFTITLNKDKPMVGTAAHEFMHAVLFKTLGNQQKLQDNLGDALVDHVSDLGGETSVLGERLKAYGKFNKDGMFERDSNFGEETVTIMSEEIINGNLKFNENFFTKIGDVIRRFSQNYLGKEITFDTGRDVYNFVKDYSKSIKGGKINKAILRVAKEGAKGKLVEGKVIPEDTVQMSKDASDNVQRIYEDQGVAGAMDIINAFKPITSKIVERRSEAPNFDRQLLTDEIETGQRGIFDLIREYKPESGVPLAAYINKFLPSRAIEASKRVLGEEFTEDVTEKVDIAAEEVTTETKAKPKPKKIVLADRLNIAKEVDATVAKILPDLDIDKLTFKNLKNKVPSIVGKLFGIAPKKLITNANITKSELQKSQMFINKNADLLIKMLPEGSTEGGMATGVPKTLLNEFYTKGERAKMAKTGTKAGLPIQQKNNINKKQFLEVFGIVDGKPNRTDRNTSARVLSLANTLGKMITNQAVRQQVQIETFRALEDGKSTFMFSKENEAIAKKAGILYYDTLDQAGAETYVVDLVDKVIPIFDSMPGFLNTTVAITTSIMPNKLVKDAKSMLAGYMGQKGISFKTNKDYARTKFDKKLIDNSTNKELQRLSDRNVKNFKSMWLAIYDGVQKDKSVVTPLLHWLKGSTNEGTHPQRIGSELTHIDRTATGTLEFEHALPNNQAYRLLMDAAISQSKAEFTKTLETLQNNYKLIVMSKKDSNKLSAAGYKQSMPEDWNIFDNNWWERYFNEKVLAQGGINPENFTSIVSGQSLAQELNISIDGKPSGIKTQTEANKTLSKAMFSARTTNYSKDSKGISILDFDDTLATTKSLVKYTAPDGTTGTLNAEQFASTYEDLQDQGYTFDFSDFNKVVKGKLAPLFNKAIKLQKKFGPENMFVLTARPPQAQKAIFDFLKANGLNIPLKNITGLGNSTSEAKALWVADKVGEGYNDFYFADDALQNVQAVKNMLDQFDVKSKVQQAKIKFSKGMSREFNDILEGSTGVESMKEFSDAQAKIRGARTKYKSIIPASAQDFAGLLYNFLGRSKKGEADMAFFKKALIDPFARGINDLNASKQSAANDYENLQKQYPQIKKTINKKAGELNFTNDQAVRVYLWDKAGFDIPGLSKRDLDSLKKVVNENADLKAFAEGVGIISKEEAGYSAPGDFWLAETITSDLLSDSNIGDKRADFLAEWQQNKDVIFSPQNLNKIEAIYGSKFREALQDILYRMETGRNRPTGSGRLMNTYMNWVNNSVGAIMFFNMRSALLQTISATNFINWSDNNPLKAAAAFANQPQYWKDFAFLFNSDFLKQRRAGNQRGINEAELSSAVAGAENKAKAAIAWLLKKGFLPTQIADSFAIASGGATFYRNRVKKYIKEGLTQQQAEEKAFLDFQETSEVAQQSARPDMISQQQASPLGRLILAFQNTPMQYARIINKASRDLVNGRGDYKTHISKIAYYGVVQSIIFGALQSALFAALGEDDEEQYDKKKERILNGALDSILSGIGYGGKAISTVKNTAMTYLKERDKGFRADHTYTILSLLSFSPPIGSKLRKIYSSIQTEKFNKDVFKRRGFSLDNPIWSGIGNVVEGFTNIPLGRLSNKMLNIDNALDANNELWQRLALVLGWNTWDLGIKDPDIEAVKSEIKEEKKQESKKQAVQKAEEKKKEKKEKQRSIVEENKKKKDGRCAAVSSSGKRCKNQAVKGGFCTIHEETEKLEGGKKVQCRKRKADGTRCKMQTSNKSKYCYYHD